jgi:hypothetical protein
VASANENARPVSTWFDLKLAWLSFELGRPEGFCANLSDDRGARRERDPENSSDPADVVGYSRLAGADEDRTLARLRALRSDLIDSTIAVHHGRVVKRTGDGGIVEFHSVVDAVRCAIEVQNAMVERNAVVAISASNSEWAFILGDVVGPPPGEKTGEEARGYHNSGPVFGTCRCQLLERAQEFECVENFAPGDRHRLAP